MSRAAAEAVGHLALLAERLGVPAADLGAGAAHVQVASACFNDPAHRVRQQVPAALAAVALPFACPVCEVTWVAVSGDAAPPPR
jgi:hypothetical protein